MQAHPTATDGAELDRKHQREQPPLHRSALCRALDLDTALDDRRERAGRAGRRGAAPGAAAQPVRGHGLDQRRGPRHRRRARELLPRRLPAAGARARAWTRARVQQGEHRGRAGPQRAPADVHGRFGGCRDGHGGRVQGAHGCRDGGAFRDRPGAE